MDSAGERTADAWMPGWEKDHNPAALARLYRMDATGEKDMTRRKKKGGKRALWNTAGERETGKRREEPQQERMRGRGQRPKM